MAIALPANAGGREPSDGPHGPGPRLDHIFLIMLENHSQSSVIGDANAPFINSLAQHYATADNYYGVTHPSEPNYVAAISGSNWFVNNDDPANRYDHTNLVDQLEANHVTWGAYMESMPSAGYLGDFYPSSANPLYASKHNPFVLFDDIRNDPSPLANVKPYTALANRPTAGADTPDFVWITPNQCHDMHGGVYSAIAPDGSDGTPCPYGSIKDDPNDAALKQKADELRLADRARRRSGHQPVLARRDLRRRPHPRRDRHEPRQDRRLRQRRPVQPLLVPRDRRGELEPRLSRERLGREPGVPDGRVLHSLAGLCRAGPHGRRSGAGTLEVVPAAGEFRLDELGTLQFERLCVELLRLDRDRAEAHPWGLSLRLPEGIDAPGAGRLDGPTLVLVVWTRPGSGAAALLGELVADALAATDARSLLLATNLDTAPQTGVRSAVLGPAALWELYAAAPAARFRVPTALGVAELDALVPGEAARRSTADVAAAVELARVFVPTQAYLETLGVLGQHRFAVLTGPPEMGKTAIARMVGLAALTDGWEVHECVRPDELWSVFARDRRQVFVADDAFGSTEYRPDAAERWAVELDAILRAMDERHWLLWTSRPAPLRAGLRRIHREHGVERFPQPAEIGVDTALLDASEKALVLFRHAKAAALPHRSTELVRAEGWHIVSHPHFTPERIRRFVAGRLRELASGSSRTDVTALVAEEIREPTAAMTASYRSLAPDHRAVLIAVLDAPPGPVSERDLAASVRRHSPAGLPQPPAEIVDRLADHFLRPLHPASVTWVHPSWRDLVIDELAHDAAARRAFLHACGVHGAALALSTAGGAAGDRALPLLRDDGDWDALADRLAELVPELDAPETTLVLTALAEARRETGGAQRFELDALAVETLERLARAWSSVRGGAPVGLLAEWLALASDLPDRPALPALAATWVELAPTGDVDLGSATETTAFDDWTVLAELLREHEPNVLRRFGFPAAHAAELSAYVDAAERIGSDPQLETRDTLVRTLRRIARLTPPPLSLRANLCARWVEVEAARRDRRDEELVELRPLSPDLERLLAQPLPSQHDDQAVVARVLRDL